MPEFRIIRSSLIGDNAVTSSIRIAQVFPDLGGKKARASWKVYRGMLKYVINYTLYLEHYMHILHINDDAKKCRYLSVTNNFKFSHNSFKGESAVVPIHISDSLLRRCLSAVSVRSLQ